MGSISYSRRVGIVTVTSDDGTAIEWPLDQFEADPAACVAQTGNGITPPAPEPDKLAALEKENIALREALIAKGVITKAEIDAKAAAAADPIALEIANP